ncbi:HalOD1 output domain-containing protein [Natronococcus jeotgali]|uniref:Halobacterial output domain-containing protein n=1 Tax=Natronococcus jeotgali DSM 18795 TaxID=1227498 RepID=L9WUK0_9EURY|nr:HalOD1 output domain-containing protein [Natronococcus jeotgali]ELY53092.1 hypothetical protein C492_18574 [Natronococcus jeotgali DSM 18795]
MSGSRPGGRDAVSVEIVKRVAERTDREPENLPSLHRAIDSEALDSLFEPPQVDRQRRGGVEFSYAGYYVTVPFDETREITVSEGPTA